jgi:hypothetical protein
MLLGATAQAQNPTALEQLEFRAENRPLQSLARAAEASQGRLVVPGPPREVPNFRGQNGPNNRAPLPDLPAAGIQTSEGASVTTTVSGQGFDGTPNSENGRLLGFRIAPPDTDGHIGGQNGQYFVQMINLLTTVFDAAGNIVLGPFPSNEIWSGIGGNCEAYNQGDPIVLYDDQANRWLFSQFAFPDNMRSFSQCVAISQTEDPTSGYNRYEFSFTNIGFNDYPKHGIVTDSITMMANIFSKFGRQFFWGGTFLGVMDKAAMYAGGTGRLRGFNIGTGEFGFVAGDLDGPGTAPALFATAMTSSNNDRFDIWEIQPNWSGNQASIGRIADIGITPFDSTLCNASRGACIPQPDGGPALESLSDRLMHRLQIRDFSNYRTMLAAHTVDTGGGRAGIRWYEMRDSGSGWGLHQEGTYAPDDGQYRWMPSIAMNGTGAIGLGFLLGGPITYMSVAATGQSAGAPDNGQFDATELLCVAGGGVQSGVARSGDYASTSVDPSDDLTFWHTNEYVAVGGNFVWDTYVCPFTIGGNGGGGGGGGGNNPPTAVITTPIPCTDLTCTFDAGSSSDPDGDTLAYSWDFGDGNGSSELSPTHTYESAGSKTITLVVSDGTANDTTTATATPTDPVDPGEPTSLSVAAIVVDTENGGGGVKSPRAFVTVNDDLGNPVSGATVTGYFEGDAADTDVSGDTGADGVAILISGASQKGKVKFSFCISTVSGPLDWDDVVPACVSN